MREERRKKISFFTLNHSREEKIAFWSLFIFSQTQFILMFIDVDLIFCFCSEEELIAEFTGETKDKTPEKGGHQLHRQHTIHLDKKKKGEQEKEGEEKDKVCYSLPKFGHSYG